MVFSLSACSTTLKGKNANYQSNPPYTAADYGYVTTSPQYPFMSRYYNAQGYPARPQAPRYYFKAKAPVSAGR